jgi:hypothetical protein
MQKPKPSPAKPDATTATVEAVQYFKHDGEQVKPGDLLRVAVADAVDLVAVGAATYGRRDMRSKG